MMIQNHDVGYVEKLERELNEMTLALSQAWDQLVPLLQEVPTQAESPQDIEPILLTIAAAAAAELAGVYLFKADEWHCRPESVALTDAAIRQLKAIAEPQPVRLASSDGQDTYWVFAPVMSEGDRIGILGVGTKDPSHSFTAVDQRIVIRTAERIGSKITAAQLLRLREKEMIRARDMHIANDIQQSIQPEEPPSIPQVQMGAYWQPASEVGGDAWGWMQVRDDQLAWFMLDVAGKGPPAALAAVALHTAISMALRMRLSPMDALQAINAQFYMPYTRTDLMATVVILSLNIQTGVLEIANAGHPPLLVRHDRDWLRLTATTPPIGVLPTIEPEPQVLMLKPGDLVICHSDGFSEIQLPKGLWGQTGLLRAIPSGANDVQALTNHLVNAARYAGEISDDQTLIATNYVGNA